MFNLSLSDRLKAAVNQLEATGTQLQARAGQATSPSLPSGSTPPPRTSSPIPRDVPLPVSPRHGPDPKSPTGTSSGGEGRPAFNAGQLAEGALSGLRGLRGGFGFNRSPSTSSQIGSEVKSGQPSISQDKAGSSSASVGRVSQEIHSPIPSLPPPNPDDPATYPLPPSPIIGATDSISTPEHDDPLRSPVKSSAEVKEVPELEVVDATPVEEKPVAGLGLGPVESEKNEETRKSQDGGDAINLQTQILAADQVLRDLTPLDGGISDPTALEGWVRMVTGKVSMMGDEMKRLQDKLTLQDSRMEEVRDTHRLESSSQTELVTKLRTQLSTAESNLASRTVELSVLPQLKTDLTKAQTQAKEEEEKRTKAISLLKTVRLKLVKAEKDKEEVERDRAEERAERSRATEEVERVKAEMQKEVARLRQGFERELAGVKDRAEKDMKERKGSWELEMITTKAIHAKDITSKTTMINGLESIVKELSAVKDEQFHTIQARQAEAESARAESETYANRTKELEFQLREANERITLLEDTPRGGMERGRPNLLSTPDRYNASPSPSPSRQNSNGGSSASEVSRLLAEAEVRAEARLSDLRFKVRSLEKERNDQEEEFGQKLQERVFEIEKLKRSIQEKEGQVGEADQRVELEKTKTTGEVEKRAKVEKELRGMMARLEEAKEDVATAQEGEKMAKDELSQLKLQLQSSITQLEEQKHLVQTLRAANKTIREEMRKVQSSAQLMEKSRNPGVGYWSATANGSAGPSGSSTPGVGAKSGEVTPLSGKSTESVDGGSALVAGSGAPPSSNGATKGNDEEEVNLEYLRNVILQFLENPLMRRQLVQVLAVILHFTPQELRRLNAKITA